MKVRPILLKALLGLELFFLILKFTIIGATATYFAITLGMD